MEQQHVWVESDWLVADFSSLHEVLGGTRSAFIWNMD
jgi:hypothetical protein